MKRGKLESLDSLAKVAYTFGRMQTGLNKEAQSWDWEEVVIQCENVVIHWDSFYNIKSDEEECYVMVYASRVFEEKFGKEAKTTVCSICECEWDADFMPIYSKEEPIVVTKWQCAPCFEVTKN